MTTLYPMTIELQAKLTSDGGTEATVTYQLPMMRVPDDEAIRKAFSAIKDKVDDATKGEFRFMTHEEFVNAQIQENTGGFAPTMAIPPLKAGEEWFSPAPAPSSGEASR